MAQPKLTVEAFGGSTQISVEGLLQLTVLNDGSVQIDLAGRHVEVERNGWQHVATKRTPPGSPRHRPRSRASPSIR